jgi:hypothetical protein
MRICAPHDPLVANGGSAETDTGLNVIAEIKGQVTDSADVKAKAAPTVGQCRQPA